MKRRSKIACVDIIAAVGLAVLPAFGAEGRTPLWEPTVITAPGSAPGKYVLTRDITIPPFGIAIDIIGVPGSLEDIELDLNGFTVEGSAAQGVIRATDLRTLTIRNGTIQSRGNTTTGISVTRVTQLVIEDIKMLDGMDQINMVDVENIALRRNVLSGFTRFGIVGRVGTNLPITGTVEDNVISGGSGAMAGIRFDTPSQSLAAR